MSKLNSYFQFLLFGNRKVKFILALDFILEKICFKRDETCGGGRKTKSQKLPGLAGGRCASQNLLEV